MTLVRHGLTLEEFLKLPEEKPALEYLDGRVTQKVSPKGRHSALQSDTMELFNRLTRPQKVARAFTELRATFVGASPVPDVAVYRWERIPRTRDGEIADDFTEPPDIAIDLNDVVPGVRFTVAQLFKALDMD